MTAAEKAQQELNNQAAQAHDALLKKSNEALDLIDNAEKKATQRLASAAFDAEKIRNAKGSDDHDLLIGLNERMKLLRDDIKELKDGYSQKIHLLETAKADKKDFETLEKAVYVEVDSRLKTLEIKTNTYNITLSLFTVAVSALIGLIIYHIFQ